MYAIRSYYAVVLNALTGRGVHLITVNDYLARRDAEWMGAIYRFLGLSVGVVVHGMDDGERQAAYRCDVTYGTNNEFGFDYLRDNMKFRMEDMAHVITSYSIHYTKLYEGRRGPAAEGEVTDACAHTHTLRPASPL